MKKVLSLLLAVVMVIGMLPLGVLTASAATAGEPVKYTFSSYTAGTQYAENEEHVLDETVTVVTTQSHFTTQLRLYSSSSHNGYAIIKCTDSTLKISDIAVNAGYKVDALDVYGSNDDGATWTKIGSISVTSTSYKDYSLSLGNSYQWLKLDVAGTQQVRVASMTLTFVGASEEVCAHANKVEQNDGYAPTCTEVGKTNSVYCPDCQQTITPQSDIPATGHTFTDGACSVCGAADPAAGITAATTPVVGVAYKFGMRQNGLAGKPLLLLTGEMSGYYGGTTTDVAAAVDTYLEQAEGGYYIYTQNDTTKQYINIVVSGTYYNFKYETAATSVWTLNTEYQYVKTTASDGTEVYLGTYGTNQTMGASKTTYISDTSKIGVSQFCGWFFTTESAGEDCAHTNTTVVPGKAATCTEDGLTDGVVCADCGVTVTEQTTIKAPGHSYVNGTCSACGAAEPIIPDAPTTGNYVLVTDLTEIAAGGKFVIVANFNGTNYAMAETTSKKPAAIEVTVANDKVAFVEGTTPVWTVAACGSNIALMAGDEYLSYGTSGTDFVSTADAYEWVVAAAGEGTFTVTASTVDTRGVAFQYNGGSPRFGAYATSNAESTDNYCFALNFYKLTAGETEIIKANVVTVENGTATTTESQVGATYTLPTATAPEGYTFAGWVGAEITEEITVAPAEVYAAGTEYTLTGDATFYALYSRTETVSGGTGDVNYVKVTEAPADWSGDYLIVQEDEGFIFNGTLSSLDVVNNYQAVTITDGVIAKAAGDAYKFTIAAMEGGYSIKAASGMYIGHSADANKITSSSTEQLNTLSMNDDGTVNVICEGGAYLRFNTADGQDRFRYFKSGTYTNQQPITLYKATVGAGAGSTEFTYYTTTVEVVTPAVDAFTVYTNGVAGNSYAELEDALKDYNAATSYIKVLVDTEVNVTLTADLYIDLNGNDLTGIMNTNGFKVYGMDGSTDEFTTQALGYFTCVDENEEDIVPETIVQTSVTGKARRYLAIYDAMTGYSFHRFYLGITHATVKPGTKGVGYKAVFAGDDMVKAQISSFGYTLQLEGNDAVTQSKAGTEMVSESVVTLRVDNYDAEKYGTTNLSASVFMVIGKQTITADAVTMNLKTMVEAINDLTLTTEQKAAMAEWIAESDTMKTWDVSNIYTATEEGTTVPDFENENEL